MCNKHTSSSLAIDLGREEKEKEKRINGLFGWRGFIFGWCGKMSPIFSLFSSGHSKAVHIYTYLIIRYIALGGY